MDSDWVQTGSGNWVLVRDEAVEATVYSTDSGWGAVWNGAADGKPRRLKGKFAFEDRAISAVETAIAEGRDSAMWWPPEADWQPSKKGGCHRKHNGLTIAVKQATSGSWYAANVNGSLLGQGGRPTWFPTQAEARNAVDAFTRGTNVWTWIRPKEDA